MKNVDQDSADSRVQTICLLILAFVASGFALALLRPVLVPVVLAIFFTYCLTPVIDIQMRRFRMPRLAAVVGAAIIGLLMLGLVGLLVGVSVSQMSDSYSGYRQQFNTITAKVENSAIVRRLGIKADAATGRIFTLPADATSALLSSVLSETTGAVSIASLVVIFMIFILFGRGGEQPEPGGLLAAIEARVKQYLAQMVFFSILTGLLVGISLAILGVPFAGLFGFMAFLMNFIPSIGAVIATLLPLPVVFLSPELSIVSKVLAMAIPGTIQFFIGIVQPKFQGDALELHPVSILMALIFFGMIWGIVGAFLATPITAVLKIIFEKIPATRPLAALLAGELNKGALPKTSAGEKQET